MNQRILILVGAFALIIGCIIYVRFAGRSDDAGETTSPDDGRIAERREETDDVADQPAPVIQNDRVPGDFIVDYGADGLWRLGKSGTEFAMALPYKPRLIPSPATGLSNLTENPGFMGAESCKACHEERHGSFVNTAHHLTSAPASRESISGSFASGENKLRTASQSVSFEMIERDGRQFQRVSFFNWKCDVPFDLVTGSSKLGQTYLYWHDDALFQMNVSYVTEVDNWVNSPGFEDGKPVYARPINPRCLECHTTWADVRRRPNHFTPGSVIFGISCERCHGPGREHVEFHQKNPDEKAARFITHPASLTRVQQLDICGQCHFGTPNLKDDPYQFRPGDRLSDHYLPPKQEQAGGVHSSNQLMRLSISPCFAETEMTCVTCHNPHQKERGNRKLFSQRCLKCHESSHCGMEPTLGDRLNENCIDCHMPAGDSENMFVNTAEGKVFPPLRDHHIRIDRKATEAYLKKLNQ